jgi:NADH:ubiquinone oxidoreductase subunit C
MLTERQKRLLEDVKNNLVQTLPEAEFLEDGYDRNGTHLEIRLVMRGMRRVAREMKAHRLYLETITAVDFLDHFELIYLFSTCYEAIFRVMARIKIPAGNTAFTLSAIYPEAIWLEREVYDFFGIRFLAHPNLKRILLPDDATIFPLLKTFGKTRVTEEIDDILC